MTSTVSEAVRAHLIEKGTGRPVLVLHGGGGPFTVAPIADHLAATKHALTPTHPGWSGTPLPSELRDVHSLAVEYIDLLRERGLTDVVVIGSSIGGWLAADIAATAVEQGHDDLIGALVVIDGTGLDLPDEPAADFAALDARQRAEIAWHDAELGYRDPATLSEAERAVLAGNARAMGAVAGRIDPAFPARIGRIGVPTLVVWGASDRVVTPAYGRAYAALIPGARFVEIAAAGHLPQLEQPEATFAAIDEFLAGR